MTLKQYAKEVNKIYKAEVKEINKKFKKGLLLFGAVHFDYPEYMLDFYQKQGFTPQQAIKAIREESEAEGRFEALAS